MTFTCNKCGGECKYAIAPPVCPYCQDSGLWHDRGPSHFAQHVPIVDQPEAYAKIREQADAALVRQLQSKGRAVSRNEELNELLKARDEVLDAHRELRELRMAQLQPTAYDRDQQALRDRIAELERRADGQAGRHCKACREDHAAVADRFNAALRRIELLELEVAKLKAPRNHRREVAEFYENRVPGQVHVDYAYSNLEDQAALAKQFGGREPVPEPPFTHLPCGCWNDVHGCRGHASPATAYPPLPDEGT